MFEVELSWGLILSGVTLLAGVCVFGWAMYWAWQYRMHQGKWEGDDLAILFLLSVITAFFVFLWTIFYVKHVEAMRTSLPYLF